MSRQSTIFLRASSALAAIALGATATIAPETRAQSDQSTAGGAKLEELVVTARRRAERIQTVPIAITAFSQATLEQRHINEIHDLTNQVPSIGFSLAQSDSNGVYSSQLRLRGLPGTEIYLADVPIGNADFQAGTGIQHGLSEGYLYDLEGLEVVKGPQGTLFGKNSVGGLISIKPKKPTNQYEGDLQVTFGNYGDKEVRAAVNIPIVKDKLLVRIAGVHQERDGYTNDVTSGKDLDNKNYYGWRVGVTFRPTDDIENYFSYDGYWQDTNGSSEIVKAYNPKFAFAPIAALSFNQQFFENVLHFPAQAALAASLTPVTIGNGPAVTGLFNQATFGQTLGAGLAAGGFSLYPGSNANFLAQQALGPRQELGNDFQGIGKDYFYGFTNQTNWDITDDLTLKNIAAARIFKQLATIDYAPIGIPILNIGIPGNNREWGENEVQYTEELQFQGKSLGEKLSWVLGGYLEFDHPLGSTTLGSANLGGTIFGGVTYNHFNTSARSQALFGTASYDFSDYVNGLKLTGGYRYTWDFYEVEVHQSSGIDGLTRKPDGTPVNCPSFVSDNNCFQSLSKNFSSPGWNVSLEEQLDPTTLLYIRAGNAYRPGGFNTSVSPEFSAFGPEHITDVEGGVKLDWDLFGVHGRTNVDGFHSDYKAIQVQSLVSFTDPHGQNHTNSLYQNAAGASIDGAEIEATFLPVKGLEVDFHGSYIDAKYDQYPTAFGASASSEPFFYFPRISWGVNGTYHLPLDESVGDVAVSANWSFYGHQVVQDKPGEVISQQPSHSQLDLRVDWTNIFGSSVDAGFFMTNALDTLYIRGVIPIYTQLGFSSVSYSEPRMFGFSLKYHFSEDSLETESTPSTYVPPAAQPVAPAPVAHSYMVFFDFDKSDLTPQAVQIVDQAAANAGPAKVTQITLTGHTDTVGSDAYNLRLSRRRAESVAAELEKRGVPSSEIEIVAKGKTELLVPTADGVKEPQNRRVQIVYGGAMS